MAVFERLLAVSRLHRLQDASLHPACRVLSVQLAGPTASLKYVLYLQAVEAKELQTNLADLAAISAALGTPKKVIDDLDGLCSRAWEQVEVSLQTATQTTLVQV